MFRALSIVTAAIIALAGCSKSDDGPRVIAKGKIVDGAKPYAYEAPKGKGGGPIPPPAAGGGGVGLQIQFIPVEGGDTNYATFNAEGSTFEVKGSDGKGIKPGKYKVFLTMAGTPPGGAEIFGGKFSREKSQIEREVTVDGPEIVIDVSKPKG
jgi:hypothetical protein